MFISGPYIQCPKCRKHEFGVLMINDHSYVRRCRDCFYDQGFALPRLQKKVIYLDQFVISNAMKAINPNAKSYGKTEELRYYKELFEKLDRLIKMQHIVCPSSSTHLTESLVDTDYQALRRLYNHFSSGVSFLDNKTIERFQITADFKNWLGLSVEPITVDRLSHDRIHAWQGKYIIDVDLSKDDEELPDRLRKERDELYQALLPVFRRWQSEKGKAFKDWFEEEINSFGRATYTAVFQRRRMIASKNPSELTLDDLMPSDGEVLIADMHRIAKEAGIPKNEIYNKVAAYLVSEEFKQVPYPRISSMLLAALANKAALGGKKPPTRGVFNDIEFIAALAPYCDALFVDKEFQTFLDQEPLKTELGLSGKIYSLNKKSEFIAYLDGIEANAPKGHLAKVEEVYGDWYNHPFTSMFEKKS